MTFRALQSQVLVPCCARISTCPTEIRVTVFESKDSAKPKCIIMHEGLDAEDAHLGLSNRRFMASDSAARMYFHR